MRFLTTLLALLAITPAHAGPLANTKPLTTEGDLAAQMVQGIDKYLMRELAAAPVRRGALWKPDLSSPEAYSRSLEPNRARLAHILGVVDKRLPIKDLEFIATLSIPALVVHTPAFSAYAVRWPVFEAVDGEGLLLQPRGKPVACVIALPDADWTPEMLVGIAPGLPRQAQFARSLAEHGCQVLIPTLINRADTWSGNPRIRMTNMPHREFIYRMAFELGRHIIGYEIQKVLAAVDWLTRNPDHPPVGVFGYGEGGLLALCSGALDPRIKATAVSGYFGPREHVWQEPIYRNVWALLHEFGDAELANLIAPRVLIVEASKGPELAGPPAAHNGHGAYAAPGRLVSPPLDAVQAEVRRASRRTPKDYPMLVIPAEDPGSHDAVAEFEAGLTGKRLPVDPPNDSVLADARKGFDANERQHRQFDQLVEYTQRLLRESGANRQQFFWSRLDLSSLEKFQASTRPLRANFWEEVIGKLPAPTQPLNVRSRLIYDEPRWQGHEVVLDLYPDVFAYGILLLPRDLKPGERRPVVVCQHGLEGRAQDAVNPKVDTPYYHSFGARLADRGFIVYAPQNPYFGQDKFRVLQRMANPLKLSLFSFIVRQHERTLEWLAGLPMVDPGRIAFYGLSYGGKTAMRVPALVERYAMSVCSGDFNEWIWKNVTTDFPGSYALVGEYEMFEFNLGQTFNYAEMAGLIAPRPFMVERGHDDGCSIDEYVAFEFAKVRRLYAKLGLPRQTEIEFFNSGHEIHAQGTFAFLSHHLHWPK